MSKFLSTSIGRLRLIGYIEGISYLMLFGITMPLKYFAEMGQPNKVIGMIHGVFFIGYVLALIPVAQDHKWKAGTVFWSFVASLLPFGTFVADKKIFQKYV